MQPSKSYFIFGAKVSIAGIVVCPSSLSALAGNASVKSWVNVNKTEIILSISIVLWFLASNGPQAYTDVEKHIKEKTVSQEISEVKFNQMVASAKLENSYIGIMGKSIEPLIKPLGYDWKIGIALISSFAAREVFVGT